MSNDIVANEVKLFDEQIEQQLLGCVLIKNSILMNIEMELSADSFYFEFHKILYTKIQELLQNNRQADEQTLFYSLNNEPNIDYQGEELKKYISSIILMGTGAVSTPKEMVNILNFLALKRKLSTYNNEVGSVIQGSSIEKIDEQISFLEQGIYDITNDRRSQDSYTQLGKYTKILADKLQKARKSDKTILGVRTGLTDIDNYTGGLQKGDLIIIAARPSMGKTALATTIAKNVATILRKEATNDEKQAIAMFSLEMSGEQLAARIVSMDSSFNTKTIHTGRYDEKDETGQIVEQNKKISDADWNKIYQSMQDVSNLPLYIDDTPALNISILRSRARYIKNRYNVCAIIIDYLQLLQASRKYSGNRVLELAEITGTLKAIAKELEIPVIALSQLSRAVEGNDRKDKRPQLSDLRESGTIEQDADIVMLLYREEYYLSRSEPKITDETDDEQLTKHAQWLKKYENVKNLADIIVAKNRNGPVGTITLFFDKEHMLFGNYDKTRDQYNYVGHTIIPTATTKPNTNLVIENQDFAPSPFKTLKEDDNEIPDDLKNIFE